MGFRAVKYRLYFLMISQGPKVYNKAGGLVVDRLGLLKIVCRECRQGGFGPLLTEAKRINFCRAVPALERREERMKKPDFNSYCTFNDPARNNLPLKPLEL